jgi:hypothetical protein
VQKLVKLLSENNEWGPAVALVTVPQIHKYQFSAAKQLVWLPHAFQPIGQIVKSVERTLEMIVISLPVYVGGSCEY